MGCSLHEKALAEVLTCCWLIPLEAHGLAATCPANTMQPYSLYEKFTDQAEGEMLGLKAPRITTELARPTACISRWRWDKLDFILLYYRKAF